MDLSGEKGSIDPMGHSLFRERVQMSIAYLSELLELPPTFPKLPKSSNHWIITGVGSSEAHGRFLTHLVNNYSQNSAEFWPLTLFTRTNLTKQKAGLIVISQGLSNNALLALNQLEHFEQGVLFSSVSKTTESTAKKNRFEQLIQQGITHVPCIPDNEYTLLVRVIGPLTGYLSCIQWVNSTLGGKIPEHPSSFIESLTSARRQGNALASTQLLASLHDGCTLLTQGALSQYSQNLGYKLAEGLFIKPPHTSDLISFGHGLFQALYGKSGHMLLLAGNSPREQYLAKSASPLIKESSTSHTVHQSQLTPPWDIFEYETLLNGLLEEILPLSGADQINWPGKDRDGPLYNIDTLT